jgi:RNA methyltransferase, RsmE family
MSCYFFPQIFRENLEVILDETESHHAIKVCRAALGDSVDLINGEGQKAQAKVISISKKNVTLVVQSVVAAPALKPWITLAWAFPQASHLSWGIEKAVELGVSEIWLFPGERSQKREINTAQEERLQHLVIAATKQSGALYMPKIRIKPSIQLWNKESGTLLFASLRHADKMASDYKREESITLVIGPESGFSEKEETALLKLDGKPVRLGPYVLRTETAVVAGLSQLRG